MANMLYKKKKKMAKMYAIGIRNELGKSKVGMRKIVKRKMTHPQWYYVRQQICSIIK